MKVNFNKFKYLGNVIPIVPDSWNHLIFNMLIDIDHCLRPRWFPRFLLNSKLNSSDIFIKSITQKFGTLRVKHTFDKNTIEDEKIRAIISSTEKLCNNTCENCGKVGTTNITVKNWVKNLCPDCIEKNKK